MFQKQKQDGEANEIRNLAEKQKVEKFLSSEHSIVTKKLSLADGQSDSQPGSSSVVTSGTNT